MAGEHLRQLLRKNLSKEYEAQCLDIWDLMFENRIGMTRDLTEKLTEM